MSGLCKQEMMYISCFFEAICAGGNMAVRSEALCG